MALGAERGRVLGQVMTQGLIVTAIGVVGGLGGAFALNRLIASLLFGVRPTDAATLVAVVGHHYGRGGSCVLPSRLARISSRPKRGTQSRLT